MTAFLLNEFSVRKHVEAALIEDIGYGDITTDAICSDADTLEVFLVAREEGIFCGSLPFKLVFDVLGEGSVNIEFYLKDGQKLKSGEKIAKISGSARTVLTGERLALNYVQKMSGISSYTNKFVKAIEGSGAKIVDTRKNTPNFRIFEKYAVKIGGGSLHRFNLSDCVMLKDNHIALFGGSIMDAVKKVRENISHAHKIEVECDTIEQVKMALEAKVDIIMLDNMKICDIQKSVEIIGNLALIEVSGGVKLETVRELAQTGVNIISTSALVAQAPSLDLGFDYNG